ncbi:MAG: hypothetical protein AAGM22_01590 [Acidobacteriota bacterium]
MSETFGEDLLEQGWERRVELLWRDVETELAAVNLFGRLPLRYRTTDYGSSLERMRLRLPSYTVRASDGSGWVQPLRTLKLDDGSNWVMALLESWSLVAEVLGFYQERMVTEGFLASAIEEISVQELLRMVDYQPFPGTGAEALPIFLVSGANGMPEVVEIPKGARIQGVPLGNELPQVFETNAAVGGRAEWNQMPGLVSHYRYAPPLAGDAKSIELAGYEASLKSGDPLILELLDVAAPVLRIVDKTKRKKGSAQRPVPGSTVTPGRKSLRAFDEPATEVTLTSALAPGVDETLLTAAFRFRSRGHLFGYDAPVWSQVSDTVRRQYAAIEGGVQYSNDDGGTWSPLDAGLPELEVHCLLAAGPHLFAGTSKGLYRRSDAGLDPSAASPGAAGSGWILCDNGIGRLQICALAGLDEPSGDHLWAADTRGQVYQSSDGGESFSPIQGRVEPQVAGLRALLSKSAERLTKPLHLERPPTARPTLPVGSVHALLARPTDADGLELFAGTDKGVFRFQLPAGGWQAVSSGLPGADPKTGQAATAVRALCAGAGRRLLLGCDKGLFSSRDGGDRWQGAERGLPEETAVRTIVSTVDARRRRSTFFAGTAKGVYRSDDPERGWGLASTGLIDPAPDASAPPEITALTSRLDPMTLGHHVFAGTPAGLFRSTDGGESWGEVESLAPVSHVDALAADAAGGILVAVPFAGFGTDEWPHFHLEAGVIDLDRTYDRAVVGGWVVLRQPESVGGVSFSIFKIRGVEVIERSDFELDGLVTRLLVDDDGTLGTFDLRLTRAYLGSEGLEPWRQTKPDLAPISGSTLRVTPALMRVPESQRRMIVTGKRVRVRVRADSVDDASSQDSWRAVRWRSSRTPDGPRALEVLDRHGRQFILPAGHLEWVPAREDDEVIGEAVNVLGRQFDAAENAPTRPSAQSTSDSPDPETRSRSLSAGAALQAAVASIAVDVERYSTLRLDAPIDLLLDPTTVVVYGNVAPANQGVTMSRPLGSGDAAQSLQHFPIDLPLTYVPALTEDGFKSTLEVKVAGADWQQVPHLQGAESTAHVYMVRPDLAGRSSAIFGDGVNGARLPTGRNNVVATFRSGMWPEKLAPHQLSILQTRPMGLRHADNPLPTEPGPPPESREGSRQRMPAWLRPLDRIVSLQDFEDFVSQNTAIALALVAPLHVRGQAQIQITVAGHGGDYVDPRGALYRRLVASIAAQRTPGPPVRVTNYEPVNWLIGLRLRLGLGADRADVAERVRTLLYRRFGFSNASFGQRIFVGELVDAALEVDGVESAETTEFGTLSVGWRMGPDRQKIAGGALGAALRAEADATIRGARFVAGVSPPAAADVDPRDVEPVLETELGRAAAAGATAGDESTIDRAFDWGLKPAPNGRLEAQLARVVRPQERVEPAQLLRLATVQLEIES